MKKIILTLTMMLMGIFVLYSQNTNPSDGDSSYYIRIKEPVADGFSVGRQCKVVGEAHIPSGYHVWILCHRIDFPRWWAQGSPKLIQNGWKTTVNIGEKVDIGEDFEIIAILVDGATDAQLRSSYGQGIDLPDTDYSALRIVHKISH